MSPILSMLWITALAVATMATTTHRPSTHRCPAHEVWSPCGANPACQRTCEEVRHNTTARPCTDICVPGCVCATGYVLNTTASTGSTHSGHHSSTTPSSTASSSSHSTTPSTTASTTTHSGSTSSHSTTHHHSSTTSASGPHHRCVLKSHCRPHSG